MRHFKLFENSSLEGDYTKLFHKMPEEFTSDSPKELLSASLGATLYIPATRPDLLNDVKKMYRRGATSVVVCLEDSIPDDRVKEAEDNLFNLLEKLKDEDREELPLIFVRPRSPKHFYKIAERNTGQLKSLTGFVFPKFDASSSRAHDFAKGIKNVNKAEKLNLYYMPVIESPSVIYRETRKATLSNVSHAIALSNDNVLAVRIGATDMSSAYGLRRSRDYTVYDVHVVSSAIADIVNVLGRAESGNIITGAVWEHFAPAPRTFKTLLRESIFSGDDELRTKLLTESYDTFIREIQIDKLNGITGKTVIHPSHISIVNSLMVVTHEEYCDAMDILKDENEKGGAYSSMYKNKMNEVKPHRVWAERILNRSKAFGVSNPDTDFVDFLERFEI